MLSEHVSFIFFSFQTSGVKVADACKIIYEEVKKDKKHRYVVFHIKDGKEIDVEVIGELFAEFFFDLPNYGWATNFNFFSCDVDL